MPNLSPTEILWILNILVQIFVVLKITRNEFAGDFKYFRLYLIVESLEALGLVYIRYVMKDRNLYGWVYVGWSYLVPVFYFLMIMELTAGALKRYPAILAASKSALRISWGLIIFVGIAWYAYLLTLPTQQFPYLLSAMRYHDAAALGFTLFIFLFLAFVSWMPVPLTPNRLNHSFLLGAFFLIMALSRIMPELGHWAQQRVWSGYVGMGGSFLVMAAWLFKILEKDRDSLRTPRGQLDREEAIVMIARLDELNQTLARSGPRVVQ